MYFLKYPRYEAERRKHVNVFIIPITVFDLISAHALISAHPPLLYELRQRYHIKRAGLCDLFSSLGIFSRRAPERAAGRLEIGPVISALRNQTVRLKGTDAFKT